MSEVYLYLVLNYNVSKGASAFLSVDGCLWAAFCSLMTSTTCLPLGKEECLENSCHGIRLSEIFCLQVSRFSLFVLWHNALTMTPGPQDPEFFSFRLSERPFMTIGRLYELMNNPSPENSAEAANFIYHRLAGRYIVPQLNIPEPFASGFLMMSSACLLIEAYRAFREGWDETPWKQSGPTFAKFFADESALFPKYECKPNDFYEHIRCGILHQAETTGGYRILLCGDLFNENERTYNARLFLERLERAVKKYVDELKVHPRKAALWDPAIKKLDLICQNCKKTP